MAGVGCVPLCFVPELSWSLIRQLEPVFKAGPEITTVRALLRPDS